jgi:ATP-dependent DNA helicase RecG
MDHVSILRLIADLRRRHGELEGVEAKAAHTGTPADLFKPLSAFANRAGGGILLFGLDEDAGFKVVGVGNPRKLQEDLSGLAAQMEPPLRPASLWRRSRAGLWWRSRFRRSLMTRSPAITARTTCKRDPSFAWATRRAG